MSLRVIDLRSDTVTLPTPAMRKAMAEAPLGDDVYGEDPTVNALQERAAELTGKEAALFVPSGSMANQVSLATLTQPGDEVIIGTGSHCYLYEGGAGAVVNGLQFLHLAGDGRFSAEQVRTSYKEDNHHYSPTTVVAVENTHNQGGGAVWPMAQMKEVCATARELSMGLHLDGARIFNAQVASGISVAEWSAPFDTVAFCLSKGLGAPVGSLVCSTKDRIHRAHRYRKMFGGAMRQAGVLAAAGLYALDHHVSRLADDHANAKAFAQGLGLDPDTIETNIVWVTVKEGIDAGRAVAAAREKGVLLNALGNLIRAVTHLNVDADACASAARTLREILDN